jgi:hypothetical protein
MKVKDYWMKRQRKLNPEKYKAIAREYARTPKERERRRLYMQEWRRKNPEKAKATQDRWNIGKREYWRNFYYTKKYGLSLEGAMRLTQNPCEICGTTEIPRVIDHDHAVNYPHYRGILCGMCNLAIGHIEVRGLQKLTCYLAKKSHIRGKEVAV